MRVPRIHHPQPLQEGTAVRLVAQAAVHVARVLRLPVGAALTLFDGSGGAYRANISAINRHEVVVAVGEFLAGEVESPLEITLVQGIARGERMDFILQKATELGVARIAPVMTERCNVRLDDARQEKKQRHWEAVIISACEQSGRNRIPALLPPQPLAAALSSLAELAGGLRLALDPQASVGLCKALTAGERDHVHLLIGPEGGLSAAELTLAVRAGYQGVRLGPRILRTETAGMAALAILQSHWGDMR